jgi:hypothetical protein
VRYCGHLHGQGFFSQGDQAVAWLCHCVPHVQLLSHHQSTIHSTMYLHFFSLLVLVLFLEPKSFSFISLRANLILVNQNLYSLSP